MLGTPRWKKNIIFARSGNVDNYFEFKIYYVQSDTWVSSSKQIYLTIESSVISSGLKVPSVMIHGVKNSCKGI